MVARFFSTLRIFGNLTRKNKGQALFEFIIFTPFFLVLFAIMVEIVGVINGSINQQKATRGYYFRLIKGHSALPLTEDLNAYRGVFEEVGAYSIGWQERAESKTPIATCYKISKLPGTKYEDTCEEPSSNVDKPSGFFRVFTSYGVCSTSYTSINNGGVFYYDYINRGASSCNLR